MSLPIIPLIQIEITSGRGVITNTLGFDIIWDEIHTEFFRIILHESFKDMKDRMSISNFYLFP
jgi:hypothetical protein